ncbi:uncharacterized protein PITG_17853 [Phytophthora infestans T30-4]|uniref:Uncharacterized protein n=1 Tax=Phytophthora infestans (strain T30-4) TaxID=403677 RepID=D0NWU9_PHYIT|nr:uncharacterized protein PITG_17853 [Phytophthora infestans T30-4]EEY67536.1 conserved hypothetical protein [Phytophthora infestans T30-4]|eukprot:XP_002896395.1 conserved hypothetical protein [Phytophthora infestans T30-4]
MTSKSKLRVITQKATEKPATHLPALNPRRTSEPSSYITECTIRFWTPYKILGRVACRFLRLACSEEDHPLFRREYARNNRERGVKLLRCFPHCCPEHARRSYCGCSVHVLVTFSVAIPPPDIVLVCARFEPTRVAPLWPAGLADLARTVGATGGRQENKCRLEIGERAALPESLFGYDSSVTRTQREMTHHLVAYVFQVLPGRVPMTQQSQQADNVVVLARHASPGFLLVSYRRSGGSSGHPGCPFPAIDAPADTTEVSSSQLLSASWKVQAHQQQHLQQQQWLQQQRLQQRLQNLNQMEHETRQRQQQGRLRSAQTALSAGSASFARELNIPTTRDDNQSRDVTTPRPVVGDVDLWQQEAEATAPGFREKEQQLLILYYFLEHVTLNDLNVGAESVGVHTRPHWLRAAAALRAPAFVSIAQLEGVVASFLRNIFEATPRLSHAYSCEHATIRVCGYLFIRALWSRAVQQCVRAVFRAEDTRTSQRMLREKFVAFIVDLWEILSGILREVVAAKDDDALCLNQAHTLPALVDDVMSIVYRQSRFGETRAKISALLLDLRTPSSLTGAVNRAFRVFTAQFQDVVGLRQQLTRGSSNQTERQWCRRWLLEPGSLQVVEVASGASFSSSLLSLAQLVRELGCVDVKVAQGAMALQAAVALLTTAPMELLLDGRLRVFRALPSGTSSRLPIGGWSVGDYCATLSHNGLSIDVHFFAFDERGGNSGVSSKMNVRRVSLSLALDDTETRDQFIIVQGNVCRPKDDGQEDRVGGLNMSNSDRAMLWNQLDWTPILEIQAGYVAL